MITYIVELNKSFIKASKIVNFNNQGFFFYKLKVQILMLLVLAFLNKYDMIDI